MSISAIDDDDDVRFGAINAALPMSDTIHVNEMKPEESALVEKTGAMFLNHLPPIDSAGSPPLTGKKVVDLTSSGSISEKALQDTLRSFEEHEALIQRTTIENALSLNPAWEIIKLGLAKEAELSARIHKHIDEADQQHRNIALLLDLNTTLNAFNKAETDEEKIAFREDVKGKLAKLKEQGIDLWKNKEFNLTEESSAELKLESNPQIDQLRSNVQRIFTIHLKILGDQGGSIIEILKEMIRDVDRLVRKTNERPG